MENLPKALVGVQLLLWIATYPVDKVIRSLNKWGQNSKQIRVIGAKRGKTLASEARLLLVLLLIGLKSGASFANQSQSELKQMQSSFAAQLKTTLTRGSQFRLGLILITSL